MLKLSHFPYNCSSREQHFGYSLSLSENGLTIAVGSRLAQSNNLVEAGNVKVFSLNETSPQSPSQWIQVGSDMVGTIEREQFGISLALAGDGRRIAVGAVGGTARKGVVRVFDFHGEWNQVGQPIEGDMENDEADDVDISADGTTLVVAANGEEDDVNSTGYKRTFKLDGCCAWKRVGPNLTGISRKIALSSDASCLLDGTPSNDNKIGGGTLYRWNDVDSEWRQIAAARGDEAGDELGGSVAVSGNCSLFALGATRRISPGKPAGYVRLYQVDEKLLNP